MRWGVLAALLLATTSPAYSADITIGGSTITLSDLIGPDDNVLEAKLHGVHQARGEWITFLLDHDRWLPGHLQFLVALAIEKAADMVSTDDIYILIKKAVFLQVFADYQRTEFAS
jgi:hypothetical protein